MTIPAKTTFGAGPTTAKPAEPKLEPKPEPKPKPNPFLDEFQAIQKAYAEDARSNTFNLLLLGESGSGKTFLTRTARGPVHIDSFDPGGSKGLREQITRGHVVVDSRFEAEDPLKPFAFELWEKETERRIKLGYFDAIGTYVLDSSTTWSAAIMNAILRRSGIAGQQPRFTKDYGPQKVIIQNWLKRILSFKCDVILTGHLQQLKDEESGRVTYRFMTTGQGSTTIPLLFDEIWVATAKETSKGIAYQVLTASTGTYMARSRLSQGGKLGTYEEPDLKAILKKAGYDISDRKLESV